MLEQWSCWAFKDSPSDKHNSIESEFLDQDIEDTFPTFGRVPSFDTKASIWPSSAKDSLSIGRSSLRRMALQNIIPQSVLPEMPAGDEPGVLSDRSVQGAEISPTASRPEGSPPRISLQCASVTACGPRQPGGILKPCTFTSFLRDFELSLNNLPDTDQNETKLEKKNIIKVIPKSESLISKGYTKPYEACKQTCSESQFASLFQSPQKQLRRVRFSHKKKVILINTENTYSLEGYRPADNK